MAVAADDAVTERRAACNTIAGCRDTNLGLSDIVVAEGSSA